MNAFTIIVTGGLALMVIALLLLGFFYPGSGAAQLDWKPTRSPQLEAENEVDDLEQMIAAQNEMRRRRGAPERTHADVEASVAKAQAEFDERAAAYAAERRDEGRPMDKRDI